MACFSGPEIVNDGLVFYYDMNNRVKSWKGKPTTNKFYEVGFITSGEAAETELITEKELPKRAELRKHVSKIFRPVRLSTTVSWRDIYRINNFTLPAGSTVKFSVWLYTSDSSSFFNVNGNFGADSNVAIGSVSNIPANTWYYHTATKTNNTGSDYTVSNLRIEPGYNVHWSGDKFLCYASNPQVEISDIVTPAVEGTRSSTEALLDLTGNTTITPTSVTYNNDGTFEFDGNTQRILAISGSQLATGQITVCAWVYPTEVALPSGPRTRGTAVSGPGDMYLGIIESKNGVDSALHWAIRTSSGRPSIWEDSIPVNQWTYIVGVYNGTNSYAYKNAVKTATTRSQTGNINSGSVYYVGTYNNYSDNNHNFPGKISNVSIYNRALSLEEIKQNFENTRGKYGV